VPDARAERPRSAQWKTVLVVLGVLIGGYLFVRDALVRYWEVRRVRMALEHRLAAARARNERLRTEVRLLQSDAATVEYEIRRQLGYYAPGERVVFFPSSETARLRER